MTPAAICALDFATAVGVSHTGFNMDGSAGSDAIGLPSTHCFVEGNLIFILLEMPNILRRSPLLYFDVLLSELKPHSAKARVGGDP